MLRHSPVEDLSQKCAELRWISDVEREREGLAAKVTTSTGDCDVPNDSPVVSGARLVGKRRSAVSAAKGR
jgi:hypothetical protein